MKINCDKGLISFVFLVKEKSEDRCVRSYLYSTFYYKTKQYKVPRDNVRFSELIARKISHMKGCAELFQKPQKHDKSQDLLKER